MAALKITEDLALSILESLPLGTLLVARDGSVVYANGKAEEVFGYHQGELVDRVVEDLIPAQYHTVHQHHRNRYLLRPTAKSMSGGRILAGLKPNGHEISLQIGLTPVGEELTLVSVIESTNTIIKPSHANDSLTGLPNRQLFNEFSEKLKKLARRDGSSLAILFIDLYKFKGVNDQFGHGVGDLVIRDVAALLQDQVRGSDVVARIGGDEFVMCLYGVSDLAALKKFSTELVRKISSIGTISGNEIDVGASIGAVMTRTGEKMDITRMIEVADRLMYRSKAAGKGAVVAQTL
ncbi:sensor domain-containing diguanylate cyclase [Marinobacter sp. X15-166B]|uniref:sensor domain-containing diguanylate cyclase n=1 Tax=Marinobacter sp. X15-166B TaxID=1897620 RepID=UPI00085C09C5|nr:sensor domain-containing diguanylate cyclase [Marinobacter sp. X15-166B]OEY65420.1 hypothetical protein BG841_02420 [Marinobacter sp. X15-166B]